MDLSFWLTTFSLVALLYAFFKWSYGVYIEPARAARAARAARQSTKSVKSNRRTLAFRKRSQGSNVRERSERSNVGSKHQEAKQPAVNVQSVQAPAAAPAAPTEEHASSSDSFTLSPRELVQLSEALSQYREGATVEQAVCKAFQVTKGGSEGYRRAKAIFDAATVAPGAAPAGTYPAAPVPRSLSRRTVRRGAS